jgi:hypothetical protein
MAFLDEEGPLSKGSKSKLNLHGIPFWKENQLVQTEFKFKKELKGDSENQHAR